MPGSSYDESIRGIIRAISSNLIRAQREENDNKKDMTIRDYYLDKASADSVRLAKILFETEDYTECSRYFLSAAYSYEKAGALNQSIACFDRLIEINHPEFIERAKDGLKKVVSLKKEGIDPHTKEGKINALDFLIWKDFGIRTTDARDKLSSEFGIKVSLSSVRAYAHELKERKRATIWGGPQGREYHIYPNLADLATRARHYGKHSFFEGTIETRITDKFNIKLQNFNRSMELFIIDGYIKPKMILTVDMKGFDRNFEKFASPGLFVKALGVLRDFSDLEASGYKATLNEKLDVIDSEALFDGKTDKPIYERHLVRGK